MRPSRVGYSRPSVRGCRSIAAVWVVVEVVYLKISMFTRAAGASLIRHPLNRKREGCQCIKKGGVNASKGGVNVSIPLNIKQVWTCETSPLPPVKKHLRKLIRLLVSLASSKSVTLEASTRRKKSSA